jgi:uncharacterized membrane protein YphA (DoxX/SURF4 family)
MESTHLIQNFKPAVNLMRATFGIVPIVAGLDKFTNLLNHWEKYINPQLLEMLPFEPSIFMMIVGIVEIFAGLLVLLKPSVGGYVVAAWLALIALSLIVSGSYLDVAVRDLVMAVGAFTLARFSNVIEKNERFETVR